MADSGNPFEARVWIPREYACRVPRDWLTRISVRALASAAGPAFDRAVFGVAIADDDTVRGLNRRHRGLDETTDVLAFSNLSAGRYYGDEPAQSTGEPGPFVTPPEQAAEIGEVIISYPQAARQARGAGHSVRREMSDLLAHGLLHLLGYDHEDPEDEARMTARQRVLLAEALKIE